MRLFIFLILLNTVSLFATSDSFPVLYRGKIHSAFAYEKLTGKLWNDPDLLVLPSGYSEDWLPLATLNDQTRNFTPYSDEAFSKIRQAYLTQKIPSLSEALQKAYAETLSGNTQRETYEKIVKYPSIWQLEAETFYFKYPISFILLVAYGISLLTLALKTPLWMKVGRFSFVAAFLLHTFFLALRCYILDRPPVSNMFETIAFVPWITVLVSLVLYQIFKQKIILLASSMVAFCLLLLLSITGLSHSLDNVQPVLDSRYWLIVHVLMVVSSYGVFALSAILGHFYLFSKSKNSVLNRTILQTMYLGTFLLVCGTILGGIWAAESWGRFWDWDPKESWAFISICLYLIGIHAYQFRYIGDTLLALGSCLSFLSITFTWYGVNYILGTGLHSYGFGSGGEWIYYSFVLGDLLFLGFSTYRSGVIKYGSQD